MLVGSGKVLEKSWNFLWPRECEASLSLAGYIYTRPASSAWKLNSRADYSMSLLKSNFCLCTTLHYVATCCTLITTLTVQYRITQPTTNTLLLHHLNMYATIDVHLILTVISSSRGFLAAAFTTTLHPFNGLLSGTTQVSRYQKG